MTALFDEYSTGQPAWDEMLAAPDQPRSAYAGVYETLRRMTPEDLNDRVDTLSRHYVDTGVTFDYAGEERAFPLDLVPRVITADDWDVVDRGVKQRVSVLEMLLADIYSGEASGIPRVVRDGVLPWRIIASSEHFHRCIAGMRTPNDVRIHVSGIDLIRDESGTFRVLEDNVRVPSGVSYVISNRRAMTTVFPESFEEFDVRPVADYPSLLLSAAAGRQPDKAPAGVLHQVVVDRQKGMADRTLESWTLTDGTTWRRDTQTDGSVEYWKFAPLSGAPSLVPTAVAALPTDPADLDALVRSQVSGSMSTDEAVFVYYGDALRLGYVPPAIRQAMLVAMKRLPYIATQKDVTIDGVACLKVTYSEPLRVAVGQYYCFDESTASIVEEGDTEFASITFRSTVKVFDYVAAVPTTVTAQAVSPEGSTKQSTPTSTPS